MNVTTAIAIAVITASPVVEKPHALIVARTPAAKAFVGDAAKYLVGRGLVPITFDELNDLLEIEKQKDLAGCDDVTCYAEIVGALGDNFTLIIKPNAKANRAVLSLYAKVKRVDQKLVSHESAVEALMNDIESFKTGRKIVVDRVQNVPCGFPWAKLKPALGKVHRSQNKEGVKSYIYYDVVIMVVDGVVVAIKDKMGQGRFLVSCS